MKQFLLALFLLILLIIVFVGGVRFNQYDMNRSVSGSSDRQILHYVDPMNPAHTSKEPGIAPCGMPMEPVYAEEGTPLGSRFASSPGSITLNANKQQRIGVQVGEVTHQSSLTTIRVLGRIVPDANKIYPLIAPAAGWLEEIEGNTVGSVVEQHQLLTQIKVYNYDFYTWQQRYLTELGFTNRLNVTPTSISGTHDARRRVTSGPGYESGLPIPESEVRMSRRNATIAKMAAETEQSSVETSSAVEGEDMATDLDQSTTNGHNHAAQTSMSLPSKQQQAVSRDHNLLYSSRGRLELLNLGVAEAQLKGLEESGSYLSHIELRSPIKGYILSRGVSPLQQIDRGAECFRVADISRVWIEADVFRPEAKIIHSGIRASVSVPNEGEFTKATVSEVPARFDAASRTYKVRLEMDNPNLTFLPDMVVDVTFQIPRPAALTVPVGAVIDTGKRTVIYVQTAEGVFTPRPVVLGWRGSERVEVVSGLKEGEKIAISGTFLLDSESRMKLAAAGLMTDTAIPAQPSQPPPQPSGHESHGQPQQQPQKHAAQPAMTTQPTSAMIIDPVCGMKVNPDTAREAGLAAEAEGKTYFFCSEECRELFKQDPLRYLKAPQTPPAGHEGHGHAQPQPVPPLASQKPPNHPVTTKQPATATQPTAAKVIDPVCGMRVNPDTAREAGLTAEAEGKTYFFCSEECRELFKQDPLRYLKAPQTPPAGHEGHGHAQPHH